MSGSDHTQGRRSQRWERKRRERKVVRKGRWTPPYQIDRSCGQGSLEESVGQGRRGKSQRAQKQLGVLRTEYGVQVHCTPSKGVVGVVGIIRLGMECILPGTTVRYGNGGSRSGDETGASRIMLIMPINEDPLPTSRRIVGVDRSNQYRESRINRRS